jgi:SAM-dependent methyltransferase
VPQDAGANGDKPPRPFLDDGSPRPDARRHAPATARNRDPILEVLRRVLPQSTAGGSRPLVLEIASGTGEHAVHFAAGLPHLDWQPSEPDPELRASVAAHAAGAGLANLRAPLALDVTEPAWPLERADALVCINMIHISPWRCTLALTAAAGRLLPPGGPLVLYGPFRRGGRHTAPSNAEFDRSLRAADASWGVRDLEATVAAAEADGLELAEAVEMPANNLAVVLRKHAA